MCRVVKEGRKTLETNLVEKNTCLWFAVATLPQVLKTTQTDSHSVITPVLAVGGVLFFYFFPSGASWKRSL